MGSRNKNPKNPCADGAFHQIIAGNGQPMRTIRESPLRTRTILRIHGRIAPAFLCIYGIVGTGVLDCPRGRATHAGNRSGCAARFFDCF